MQIKLKELRNLIRSHLLEKALTSKQRKNLSSSSFVVPASSSKDEKDHFPIHDKSHARNALARVNQYDSNPPWHTGSLSSLKKKVKQKVKSKFPDIEVKED